MRRNPRAPRPEPRPSWQIAQGAQCPCRGMDDNCPCQNENPWPRPPITRDDVRDLISEAMQDRMDMDVGISELADAATDALIASGYLRAALTGDKG